MEEQSAALLDTFQVPVFLIGLRKRQVHLVWWVVWAFFKGLWEARKVDIIFLQDALLAPLGGVLAKITGKPLVITAHGLDVIWNKWWYQQFYSRFLRKADQIICVSNATKIECLKRGVRLRQISVIPNGIYSHQKVTSGDKGIVFLGRLVKRKGPLWFLKQVVPFLPGGVPIHIAGGGDLSEEVRNEAHKHSQVQFHGKVSDEEKEGLYAGASVFVMPNRRVEGDMEGFGITAIEAGSWGIPVVGTKLEGIQDAVKPDQTGILVAPDNPASFAEAVKKVLSWNKDRREKIKESTQKDFAWSHVAQLYEQIFYSVASRS